MFCVDQGGAGHTETVGPRDINVVVKCGMCVAHALSLARFVRCLLLVRGGGYTFLNTGFRDCGLSRPRQIKLFPTFNSLFDHFCDQIV